MCGKNDRLKNAKRSLVEWGWGGVVATKGAEKRFRGVN